MDQKPQYNLKDFKDIKLPKSYVKLVGFALLVMIAFVFVTSLWLLF
jgi:hypothetical protein